MSGCLSCWIHDSSEVNLGLGQSIGIFLQTNRHLNTICSG